MSKEFEEIVLEKLNILECGLKENNQKLENLEIEVKDTKVELKDLTKKVGSLETEVKDTKKGLKNLEIEVKDIKKGLKNLETEVKDTGEVVEYLNHNFTKFDYEINKKIDTLFDSYAISKENDEVHEENIISLNSKVFNHDIRISNLENKVLTA